MVPITRSSQFESDLTDTITYLANRDPDAALRVLDATEETVDAISRNPASGFHPTYLKRKEDRNVRIKIVLRFSNYLIFYEELRESVHLHRFIHASRNLPNVFENPKDQD